MKKIYTIYVVVLGLAATINANAQTTSPLMSQYFNNRYLANPAMAGINQGLTISALYRQLYVGFPGNPIAQNLSGDYGFNKVGVGLNLYNSHSGLFKEIRAAGSFSYHLPLAKDAAQQLSFGVSLGILSQRIAQEDVIGSRNDATTSNYNSQATYFDGDFGLAYTTKQGMSLQLSLPNLRNLMKRDYGVSVASNLYLAAAYKFGIPQSKLNIEPMVAYRGYSGIGGIFDVGGQAYLMNDEIFFSAMYHTNNSGTIGLGVNFKNRYLIGGTYTTNTAKMANYTGGNFEINLKYALRK